MSTYNWHKLLVDRGLMTKSEETTFGEKSTLYHQRKYKSLDKSQMEPFFGQEDLQYHRRKCSYLAFQHDSIVDLVHSISSRRPEIIPWWAGQAARNSLVISQPHNGTFFANVWPLRQLGNYSAPILKLLSSHTEVLSIFSMSNDDPCSYQRWKEGKCVRAIEWIPHPTTFGKLVDFGTSDSRDPTYTERPWYNDVNQALEVIGHAGHLIPPRKSKDEGVLAWKVYLPDIIK